MYVKSSKIKMFPSSWRRKEYNPEANLNTEENLTNITRSISAAKSYDSYVMGKDGNKITFVIHGYWFSADVSDVIVSGQPLYAKIKLVNSVPDGNTDFNNLTLIPTNASVPGQLDDNLEIPENVENDTNEFHGVEFYNSPLSTSWPEGVFELQLLDANGKVPAKSYLNISTEQVQNGAESSSPISTEFTTGSIFADNVSAETVMASSIHTMSLYGSSSGLHIIPAGDVNFYSTNNIYFDANSAIFRNITFGFYPSTGYVNASLSYSAIGSFTLSAYNFSSAELDISGFQKVNVYGSLVGRNIYPSVTNAYNLGNTDKAFKSAYINNVIGKDINVGSVHTSSVYADWVSGSTITTSMVDLWGSRNNDVYITTNENQPYSTTTYVQLPSTSGTLLVDDGQTAFSKIVSMKDVYDKSIIAKTRVLPMTRDIDSSSFESEWVSIYDDISSGVNLSLFCTVIKIGKIAKISLVNWDIFLNHTVGFRIKWGWLLNKLFGIPEDTSFYTGYWSAVASPRNTRLYDASAGAVESSISTYRTDDYLYVFGPRLEKGICVEITVVLP